MVGNEQVLHENEIDETLSNDYESSNRDKVYFGCETVSMSIDASIQFSFEQGTDYVVAAISNSKSLDDRQIAERHNFVSTEILLRTTEWSNAVVGRVSKVAFEALARKDDISTAMNMIKQEISFATYLSLPALLFPCPTEENMVHYASVIQQNMSDLSRSSFWIRVPVDKWELFNQLKVLCNFAKNIFPVVELNHTVEAVFWEKWFGEKVKAIIIPSDLSLSEDTCAHDFVKMALKHEMQIILSGSENGEVIQHYINSAYKIQLSLDPLTENESFERTYRDFLQAPLQPLFDNLESQTYEIFEKDPVKYDLYQRAVRQALETKYKDHNNVIIMVVGAGRGPLVKASLRAAKQAKKNVTIFAVEKNPNALVILNHYKNSIWKQLDVHIIHCDMRMWNPKEKADILVSELLGSFGDNELSPECLDGAQRLLKDDGISIPESYTSYLSPLMSQTIYDEIVNYANNNQFKQKSRYEAFETPYVVKVFNGVALSQPQACFTFKHPNFSHTPIDNSRVVALNFSLGRTGGSYVASTFSDSTERQATQFGSVMIHGLIGYFECKLYGDVLMSILPSTFSDGMFSWFPIVFPLTTPLIMKEDSTVQVTMYRKGDNTKVWYEWVVCDTTHQSLSTVHNISGRSYSIGL